MADVSMFKNLCWGPWFSPTQKEAAHPLEADRDERGRMYQCQGCQVMVTGHSLGGYLAEVLATTLGRGLGGVPS